MSQDQAARNSALDVQAELVEALRDPACYPHPVGSVRVIETHISYVLLTGPFAYKIKKAVDLGFLDFTTLARRRHFCEEELRLNSRLVPELYLEVVSICGAPEVPQVGGDGEAIEYAVRMREFPQEALADRVIERGGLAARQIDGLAGLVAAFHSRIARCGEADPYGLPEALAALAAQNFVQLRVLLRSDDDRAVLGAIEAWTGREDARLRGVFAQRRQEGAVRECHGDLHLGNIVLLDDRLAPFDCIEFNPDLRWIDVMNEAAFLVMDLIALDRPDLAWRFLNAYLEATGDYAGLKVLRYYLVYRALVRAKVALMRAGQLAPGDKDQAAIEARARRYLGVAQHAVRAAPVFVLITHGLSGSGKTTLSQPLVELTGAIRIRSDVERKRLLGAKPSEPMRVGVERGPYSRDATESTYGRLLALASLVVEAGYGVIVDATFLKRRHRDMFRAAARRAGVPFVIVDFTAPEETLRSRIVARLVGEPDASDADLAVLEHQLRTHEPLGSDELESVFGYDASAPADRAEHPLTWAALLERLTLPCG